MLRIWKFPISLYRLLKGFFEILEDSSVVRNHVNKAGV
jgi:hypothetical protein